FGVNNGLSPEIILSIPMPNLGNWNNYMDMMGFDLLIFKGTQWTMLNESDLTATDDGIYEDPYEEWPGDGNPMCVQPGLYGTFNTADIRRGSILSGPQYYADGTTPVYIFPTEADSDCRAAPSSTSGVIPLVYSDAIAELDNRQNFEGSVWNKYRLPLDYTWDKVFVTGGSSFFDFVLFRYAEVLLTKAECLVRLNRAGEAASVLQPIRSRAGLGNINPTLENIENEWKFEFVLEDQRRTHMIRFGTFTESDHNRNGWEPIRDRGAHTTLFPIPYLELAKNNRLKQNPGY
ncbi:MAG: RagB/SusD family nutrient uptake outer membrane protein, partial [Prevotellaceae bacterium]|nr:RagB/SusD family nutrient uptake outer membrane protein [Prevotellaceae bacterium]